MIDSARGPEEETIDTEVSEEAETIDMEELAEEEGAASIVRTHGILLLPEDTVAEAEETEAPEVTIPTIITQDSSMVTQPKFSNSSK